MSTATAPEVDRVTGEVVDIGGVPAISPATRAEIDTQIATAKRFPRDVTASRKLAMSMAIASEDVAASCCYSLKRGGKAVKGPSVRLAEIMVQAWGNIRAETRVLHADHMTIESESVCWDLERNVAVRACVKRRITGNKGRFNDDMIVMTGNAAASVAFRNAVFRVVPKTFVHEVYDACEGVAIGDIKTLAERRTKALAYFARFGVNSEQVCKRMGRGSVDELTLDDVAELKTMAEAVKRGDETIDSVFADEPEAPPAPKTAGGIADEVASQMDAAINKGKPADAPAADKPDAAASPEVSARREKIIEQGKAASKDAKPAEEVKCSPGKAGCASDGKNKKGPDGKTRYYCSTHDPDNRPSSST